MTSLRFKYIIKSNLVKPEIVLFIFTIRGLEFLLGADYILARRFPGRAYDAEKLKIDRADVLDALDCAGRKVDRIMGSNVLLPADEPHDTTALQNVIYLGIFKRMRSRLLSRLYSSPGQAVSGADFMFSGIKDLAQPGTIAGGERMAIVQFC
jgi:hypothetical protein